MADLPPGVYPLRGLMSVCHLPVGPGRRFDRLSRRVAARARHRPGARS